MLSECCKLFVVHKTIFSFVLAKEVPFRIFYSAFHERRRNTEEAKELGRFPWHVHLEILIKDNVDGPHEVAHPGQIERMRLKISYTKKMVQCATGRMHESRFLVCKQPQL